MPRGTGDALRLPGVPGERAMRRMLPVVLVACLVALALFICAAMIQLERQMDAGAEGPYRKEKPGVCVCR